MNQSTVIKVAVTGDGSSSRETVTRAAGNGRYNVRARYYSWLLLLSPPSNGGNISDFPRRHNGGPRAGWRWRGLRHAQAPSRRHHGGQTAVFRWASSAVEVSTKLCDIRIRPLRPVPKEILWNIPYGQSSAKLPVTRSLCHLVTQSLGNSSGH